MSKYIKLEDAIHNINLEVVGRKEYTGDMKANLFFALDDLPTIEVKDDDITQFETRYMLNSEDITRCYNCKHYKEEDVGVGDYQWCELLQREVEIDWYCASGERIDNE